MCRTDPVRVSPDMYHVVSESESQRELRLMAHPGQRDAFHGHPRGIWSVVRGGKGRLHDSDGTYRDVELKVGMSGDQDPVVAHSFENIGRTVIEVRMLEEKEGAHAPCP